MSGNTQPSVMVVVRLGDPHVARAGTGKRAKTASCTSDSINTPAGERAALAAAAKYLHCAETDLDICCLVAGDVCARRPAIFQAEMKDGGES